METSIPSDERASNEIADAIVTLAWLVVDEAEHRVNARARRNGSK